MSTTTYKVSDAGSFDRGLTYAEAVARIGEWYEDVASWATGEADEAQEEAVTAALAGVSEPRENGTIRDLKDYAGEICSAVADALNAKSFAGHGNYYVSAADSIGLDLDVQEDEVESPYTTIELAGGGLGSDTMLVRCNLSQASAPVEVDYQTDEDTGWQGTQYQCADTRHTTEGLIAIAKSLAARAVEMPADEFDCDATEI